MANQKDFLTAPVPSKSMPGGIPYIIGNEAAERFSFYGMKAILVIFMTKYLMDSSGYKDVMSPAEAKAWYHMFTSFVYFTPIMGAFLADYILGKYKTILSLSIVYCLGHIALAVDETRLGLSVGLFLIAMGAGGIKPCVSAHVGDQFGQSNSHLLEKVFGWFYFSINLGAFVSTLMTPFVLKHYGPSLAFGIPGGLMILATWVFWLGRKKFVHIPAGGKKFVKELKSKEGLKSIGNLLVIYFFVAMFWALFDQTGSAWVLQADKMDRDWLGITWLPSQIQAINPILIMVFIPIFTFVVYPTLNKIMKLTPLRKILIGLFITVPAFLIPAWIESQLNAGFQPNIVWQLLSYAILTAAEVFVSITCLEFSYTQAPKKMKSFVMAFFLMSVSFGNMIVAGVNFFIQKSEPVKLVASKTTSGGVTVTPKKTTTYELTCKGKKSEVRRRRQVIVETPRPSISSFTVNGKSSTSMLKAGTVKFAWMSLNTKSCVFSPQLKGLPKSLGSGGATTFMVSKTTTYLLTCESKIHKGVFAKKRVTVTLGKKPIKKPQILGFTANGQSGKTTVRPGKKVKISWRAENVKGCQLMKKAYKASGHIFVKAEKKEYLLECDVDGKKKIGARLKVLVSSAVSIDSFTINGKTSLNLSKASAVQLKWKTSAAKSCSLRANTLRLNDVDYYLFFSILMFITAFLFIFVARRYKEQTYIQDEEEVTSEVAAEAER